MSAYILSPHTRVLDDRLVEVARQIKVLSALSWPQQAADDFLSSYERGERKLPEHEVTQSPAEAAVDDLRAISKACDRGDPVERFISDTADSYRAVAELVRGAGTPAAHRLSREIYGGPSQAIRGATINQLDVARNLLEVTTPLCPVTRPDEADYCLLPAAAVSTMTDRIDSFFGAGTIAVVLDANLSAKAAASARRVRLRAGTCFSKKDLDQLIEHEVFVHSLTALNGIEQQSVRCLSLGAPRTTATQEGLATFAELITKSIDLFRLRRLAIRVEAIHRAEEGADFIEVFELLHGLGESPQEAVRTTMRVFRGGDVRGRYVFTKDVVYLRGLFSVFTFFRKAIADGKPELVRRLFSGRLALADTVDLEPVFDAGVISAPKYVPAWAQDVGALAAFLAFSSLVHRVDLDEVSLTEICI